MFLTRKVYAVNVYIREIFRIEKSSLLQSYACHRLHRCLCAQSVVKKEGKLQMTPWGGNLKTGVLCFRLHPIDTARQQLRKQPRQFRVGSQMNTFVIGCPTGEKAATFFWIREDQIQLTTNRQTFHYFHYTIHGERHSRSSSTIKWLCRIVRRVASIAKAVGSFLMPKRRMKLKYVVSNIIKRLQEIAWREMIKKR